MIIEFLLAFIVSYTINILGIAIGYHRLLSHRSFKCPKIIEYFFVLAGYFAFQSSPLWWASMHRAHHRYSDTELDPHADVHGWRRSIYGWILDESYPEHVKPEILSKDLIKDPIYRFLDQGGNVQRAHLLNGFLNFSMRVPLILLFGFPIALGSLAAGLFIQQVTLIFNKISHMEKYGYRNFSTTDDSANIPWLAIFTLGECLHNNHHARPGSANNAVKSGEIDICFWVIQLFKSLKLIGWTNNGGKLVQEETIDTIALEPSPVLVKTETPIAKQSI